MSRPKILVFIDWFDPAYKAGGPVTSNLNMIKILKNDFDWYVFTGNKEYSELVEMNVPKDQWTSHHSGAQVYYASRVDSNIIDEIAQKIQPDLVYINGLYSRYFSILPLITLKKLHKPILVAPRGMLSAGSIGVKSWKKKTFLTLMKWRSAYRNVIFHATSDQENLDVRQRIGSNKRTFVASNIARSFKLDLLPVVKEGRKLRLVCVGRVAPEKNTRYAVDLILQSSADVTLDVIGTVYDQGYYQSCLDQIRKAGKEKKIRFLGESTPDELHRQLSKYDVFLLPSTGENFGHAIIEAMAVGLPVIISDRTPWRNLKERLAGFDLPLDHDQKWLEVIERFRNMDTSEFSKWSKAALKLASEIMNDEKSIQQNRQMFLKALGD